MAHGHEAGPDHGHSDHGRQGGSDKRVAMLISVLTLFLAFSETLGKAAQTSALTYNAESTDLWAFHLARAMRAQTLRTAADALRLDLVATSDPAAKAAMQDRIDRWLKDADRYESEPDKNEGSKELKVRAEAAERHRDLSMLTYHHYEIASAALQIGIVLASASVITGMLVLAWIAGGLGVVGLIFMALGRFAPELVHLFHW